MRQRVVYPNADPTTVARAFAREGIPVKLRRNRGKPQRAKEQEKERETVCAKMMRWPLKRYTDEIDLIIDNKRLVTPTTPEARAHLAKQKVVVQLRTPQEGLQENFTKPGAKAHRKNLGGFTDVCAGISNSRIVLWEATLIETPVVEQHDGLVLKPRSGEFHG